jgi:L-aspartate oxidase
VDADYLVIGSGIAGLWFAHKAASHGRVLVVTKKQDSESNTNYAQGGIAAAMADDDQPEFHYEDTIAAGVGLARPEVVKLVTESGPRLLRELFDLGVAFNTYTDAAGAMHFDLGREGGHRRRRIVHASDFTGLEVERGLLHSVHAEPNVTLLEDRFAVRLLLDSGGRCCGALLLDTHSGAVSPVRARVTLLATGGLGQVYRHTTNPRIATGDGLAMGFRAGARAANMEFIQFHPTSLAGSRDGDRAFLVSEALRGEGAILRTRDGDAFMDRYDRAGSLARRDVVARAIASELRRSGEDHVLLDATHLDPHRLAESFPTITGKCRELGIDVARDPIPVVPAAHYVCGGLMTNDRAETSVPNLLAAGECACSGLHGANRLASNSLLEALVFADRAAESARSASSVPGPPEPWPGRTGAGEGKEEVAALREELQTLMWERAGIVRTDAGLERARTGVEELAGRVAELNPAPSVPVLEIENMLEAARLIVACAQRRPESRGLHYNEDHPETDARFQQDTVVSRHERAPLGPRG